MKSGIYQILNTINGKRYIGSSHNIPQRFRQHRYNIKMNKNGNRHLRNAWIKYGEEKFKFEVLEYCCVENLAIREQHHLDTYPKDQLYNKRPDAVNNTGVKLGPLKESHKIKLRGRTPWNKGKKVGKSNDGSFKKGLIPWNLNKQMEYQHWLKGKNLPYTIWNKGRKGWRPDGAGVQPKFFQLVSPDLVLYEGYGARKFAYEMGLTSGIYALIKGDRDKYRGWTLPNETYRYNGYGYWPNC